MLEASDYYNMDGFRDKIKQRTIYVKVVKEELNSSFVPVADANALNADDGVLADGKVKEDQVMVYIRCQSFCLTHQML